MKVSIFLYVFNVLIPTIVMSGNQSTMLGEFLQVSNWGALVAADRTELQIDDPWRPGCWGYKLNFAKGRIFVPEDIAALQAGLEVADSIHGSQTHPWIEITSQYLILNRSGRAAFLIRIGDEDQTVVKIHQVIQIGRDEVRSNFINETLIYMEFVSKDLCNLLRLMEANFGPVDELNGIKLKKVMDGPPKVEKNFGFDEPLLESTTDMKTERSISQ